MLRILVIFSPEKWAKILAILTENMYANLCTKIDHNMGRQEKFQYFYVEKWLKNVKSGKTGKKLAIIGKNRQKLAKSGQKSGSLRLAN
jgi:hypothetical protein